jgi:hypothetical protein
MKHADLPFVVLFVPVKGGLIDIPSVVVSARRPILGPDGLSYASPKAPASKCAAGIGSIKEVE